MGDVVSEIVGDVVGDSWSTSPTAPGIGDVMLLVRSWVMLLVRLVVMLLSSWVMLLVMLSVMLLVVPASSPSPCGCSRT